MYIRKSFFLLLLFALIIPVQGKAVNDTIKVDTLISNFIPEDDPIVAMLDSLAQQKFWGSFEFVTDTASLNVNNYSRNEVPVFNDSVYEARIASLNAETPFELVYNNDVKRWIHLYANKRRDLTSRMLGMAELYFPLFEEQLDKYDIPLEIKYLAIVESALNPTARSRAGAKGLWQFMYRTGKLYKLNVNSLVDDRCDPYKATVAACQHMRDLYDIYHDWSLVLAAYNSGAGNVNKAIRRSGNKVNYWLIQHRLPRETRGYVPAFIAVTYLMNFAAEHNLYPLPPPVFSHEIDTVAVREPISFEQISEMFLIPKEELVLLNPAYTKGIIPVKKDKPYMLCLRKEYIGVFLNNEDSLYKYKTQKGIDREKVLAEIKKANEREIHIVRYGENLSIIAQRYGVRVSDLKRWNNLRGTMIKPKQRLVVYARPGYSGGTSTKQAAPAPKPQKIASTEPQQKPPHGKFFYHTIEKGDTLWDIANMYDGVSVTQIKKLNNINNTRRLKPGQKIKVPIVS
jgi:membrane-bound lytic murein transglycosylase D